MGAAECGGLADTIFRLSLTKYTLSWSEGLLAQDFHIIGLVYYYGILHQMTKMIKANAAPEQNALSGSTIAI